MVNERRELEFEARFYLSRARELQKQGMALVKEADDCLELAVNTWNRAKEVTAG